MSEINHNVTFHTLPKDLIYGAFLLLGFIVFMVMDQWFWWGDREDYSFGYLVPFFVAYVLYDRWPLIRAHLLVGHGPDGDRGASRLDRFAPLLTGLALAACWPACCCICLDRSCVRCRDLKIRLRLPLRLALCPLRSVRCFCFSPSLWMGVPPFK